ncbi:MAG: ATP-binding cassette domain-containing protein [Clostridiales bacterium]|nr:ATP-binding cassette domain-containing protein [Clostridiales bacterium]
MLRLNNVTKTFGKGKNEFTALKGVSLEFPTKGLVIILGKSGSGKSTLLNIIGGLDKASSGEIIIDGKSTKEFTPKDYDSYRNTYVGMVFQEFNLIDEITLAENIAISLRLQTDSPELSRIDDALAAVGLANMGYRKPTELSGGQRQRVAIARALIKNPEIILADEPTGALDFATGEYIFDTLKKIARDKLVVVVTHDRELAYSYGDRIVEIVDGEIVSDKSRLSKSGRVTAFGDNVLEVDCGAELSLDDVNGKLKKGVNYVGIYQNRDKLAAAYPQILKTDGEKRESASGSEFAPTDNVEMDDAEFKLKEGKLKLKDAFFMAVSNIKRTKRKFIFLVAFSAVAFVFMVISFILSTLSSAQLVSATVTGGGDRGQVCVSKLIETDDGKSLIALDDNDIKVVSDASDSIVLKHYTNKLSPVFAHKQTSIDRNADGSDGTYGLDYFTGIITGSPRDLGLKVTGSDKCTNTDEIIISDLAAFELIRSGFVGNTKDGGYGIPEVDNIEQLIGSRVKIYQTDTSYKIVGVFHTDYENYSGITSASSLDSSAEHDKAEFIQNSNFIYSKVFAHAEFPQVFASMSGGGVSTVSFAVSFENNSSSGARALSRLMYSEEAVNSLVTTSGASAFLWNKDNVMSVEELRENQIVLSLFDTAKMLNKLDAYYEGDNEAIFQDASFTRLTSSSLTVTFYDGSGGIFKRMDGVRLVGVLDPRFNNPDEAGDRLLLAENDVKKLYSSNTAVNSLYFDSGTSESGLTRKINRLADKGYLVTTAAAPAQSVVAIDDAVSMLSQISLYITIAFAVFALLFMFNYVSQSIKFRTKEIAVYRIIGARGRDLSKMFLIEGLFIAVITTVVASVLSALVALLLNELIAGIMLSSFNITFGLISFKFWHVPLIFAVCLAFVGVSLLFPILNIVRKKPVDALKMI